MSIFCFKEILWHKEKIFLSLKIVLGQNSVGGECDFKRETGDVNFLTVEEMFKYF